MTHYEILGVEPTATRKQIKRAWRKCVKKTHPDKNPDDPTAEARFKEVQAAWEVLADAESRKRYDESLRAPPPPPPPPPRPEPPVHRCADCQTPIAADRTRCVRCEKKRTQRRQHDPWYNPVTPSWFHSQRERQFVDPQDHLEQAFGHLGWWTRRGVPRWME